jgi:hypothetical protein
MTSAATTLFERESTAARRAALRRLSATAATAATASGNSAEAFVARRTFEWAGNVTRVAPSEGLWRSQPVEPRLANVVVHVIT